MIIANFPYGRLGNQLELAAHLIVFAETEKKLISLQYLTKQLEYFPYFKNSSLLFYPRPKYLSPLVEKVLAKVIGRLIRLGLIKNIDFLIKNEWIYFDEKKFQSNSDLLEIKRSLLCTIKLWRFRSRTKIKEYRKQIKKVFTPHNAILDVGRGVIAGVNADIVIGVHIRWGDYKTEAPSYYHDIEVYRARMLEAQEVFRGKKLGFVVCTEEGQDLDRLTGLLCVFPKGDAITDLYTLAQCDYLIASASTFSGWAAYWGEIAAFVVDSPDKKIETIGDFEFNDLIVNH